MRLSPLLTALVALVAFVIIGAAGAKLVQPNRPLLTDAGFSLPKITPNADGVQDATEIRYTLNRNARVTIAFTNKANGQRFVFRNAEARVIGSYQVLFSGIVDGFALPGEDPGGTVEARLMPNGDYSWTIEAVPDSGDPMSASGDLTIADADPVLPSIQNFDVSPQLFTPNQDGIDDRVKINIYLPKPATLTVYLEDKDKRRYYISERVEGRKPG